MNDDIMKLMSKWIRDNIEVAILKGLEGGGLDDTPQNRIIVMHKVHEELASKPEIDAATNAFLLELENEVKRLEASISN
jgi:hypothetical protein